MDQSSLNSTRCTMDENVSKLKKEMSYSCRNCPDKMSVLCRHCIQICHKGHHNSSKIEQFRNVLVNFEETPCQCALHEHVVTPTSKMLQKEDKSINKDNKTYCPLTNFFAVAKPKYVYQRKDNKNYYCVFCMYNYQKPEDIRKTEEGNKRPSMYGSIVQGLTSQTTEEGTTGFEQIGTNEELFKVYKKKSASTFNDDLPPCSCSNKNHKHEILNENLSSLIGFLTEDHCPIINLLRISYHIIFDYEFIKSNLSEFSYIMDILMSEIDELGQKKGDNEINNQDSSHDGMDRIPSKIRDSNFQFIQLEDKMDWEAFNEMTNLFDSVTRNIKLFKYLNISIFDEKMASFFSFETVKKLLSLRSNMPLNMFKIQLFAVKMYRRGYLNIFFRQETVENENYSALHRIIFKTQPNQKRFDEGLIIIDKIFQLCNVMEESSDIPPKTFNLMFTEALKIIKKLIPLCAHDPDTIKMFHKKIEDNIGLVKEKKDGQVQILVTLEKITVLIYNYINDFNFYHKIINVKEPKNGEEGEEEEEDKDEREQEYSFTNSDFNKTLLKTLYTFDKLSSNDNLQYVLSNNLYDNLVNEHDYYSEALENLVNSSCEITNPKISKEFITLINNDRELKGQEILEQAKKLFENITTEFKKMIKNEQTEEDYLHKFSSFISEINNFISNSILGCNEMSPFIAQLLFVRYGYLNKLLHLMNMTQKIIKYLFNIEEDKSSEKQFVIDISEGIQENFKSALKLLSQNNPIIASLYYNESYFKLIINHEFKNLDFFVHQTKLLKKFNYKIYPEYLIRYIFDTTIGTVLNDIKANLSMNEQLLKLFKNLLMISADKCVLHINNLIGTKLKGVLEDSEFRTALADPLNETESKIIVMILKCVNVLTKEYFYIINPYIEIIPLMQLLKNKEIDTRLRKIAVKTYTRYFVESFFSLVNIKNYFQDNHIVCVNLVDNADQSQNAKSLQAFLSTSSDKNILIFEPIIYNLQHFKYFYIKSKGYFKNGLKSVLSFLEEMVFLPCIYSVYKFAYFYPDMTAHLKYEVYRMVYHLVDNLLFILNELKNYDLEAPENIEALNKCFSTPDIKKLEQVTSESVKLLTSKETNLIDISLLIKILMDNLQYLNIYQDKFNDDAEEEQAGGGEEEEKEKDKDKEKDEEKGEQEEEDNKGEKVLSKINSIASGEEKKENVNADVSILIQALKDEIEKYNETKGEYEDNNIFNEIFNSEENESIQYIIARDLIYRLEFKKMEHYVENEVTNDFVKGLKVDLFKKLSLEGAAKRESNVIVRKDKRGTEMSRKDVNLRMLKNKKDCLGDYYKPLINTYLETKTSVLESVCKVFKSNPGLWQDVIVSQVEITKNIINIFIKKQIPYLIQFIFIEFNRIDSKETPYYQIFINMLEFLRLLCEDHNPLFQTLLINYEKATKDIDGQKSETSSTEELAIKGDKQKIKNKIKEFFTLILKIPSFILTNIEYSKSKYDLLNCLKRYEWDYFTPLIQEVTDFLIEIMQGTYPQNFNDITFALNISGHNGFTEYYTKHLQFFNNLVKENEYNVIMSEFIRLINCFIEENSNPEKLKIPVIVKLNPKILVSEGLDAFGKLIIKYISPTINIDSHKELLNKYKNQDDDLLEDPLFNIATGIFVYLLKANCYKDKAIGDKVSQAIEVLKEMEDYQSTDSKDDKINLTKREYYLFCTTLIKVNEISFTEDKSKDEKELYRYKNFFSTKYKEEVLDKRNNHSGKKTKFNNVFFMEHPDSLYLEDIDAKTFLEKASYDNFNIKLNCILDYYPEMNKMFNGNKLLKFLFQLPYKKLEVANAILTLVTSTLMVLSTGDNIFSQMMFPFTLVHLIMLSLLVINWFTFKIITYIKWEEKEFTFLKLIKFIMNSIFNMEIFCFAWALFWGSVAITNVKLYFLFSLQPFVIFNLFQTMKTILLTMKAKYAQFLSTFFLLVIVILFYSGITFYFFNVNDDGSLLCRSHLECFLYLFNSGIRAGGLPFGIKVREQKGYWSEFIVNYLFYFINMLIIFNMINSIVVDSFQETREKNNEINEEKSNVCFICSLHRSKFEIKGISFEHHTDREHNIDNYFRYLLKILKTDEHDLNSIDFQVMNAVKQKRIEFFPIKKAKCLENLKKKK